MRGKPSKIDPAQLRLRLAQMDQMIVQHRDRQVIRHESARVQNRLDAQTERRLLRDIAAEEIARGDVGQPQLRRDDRRLRPLPHPCGPKKRMFVFCRLPLTG